MYTIGSNPCERIKASCASSGPQLYAGSDGSAASNVFGRVAGATVSQKSGTLIAVAPAALAWASPAAASGLVNTYGSTIAVCSGRAAEAAVATAAAESATSNAVTDSVHHARRMPVASRTG